MTTRGYGDIYSIVEDDMSDIRVRKGFVDSVIGVGIGMGGVKNYDTPTAFCRTCVSEGIHGNV